MKNHISALRRLAIVSLFAFPSFAMAAPTSGPYITDQSNEYVQDATTDTIGNVNMILCIVGGMNISGSGMINAGPYIALIDINKCQSHGGSSSSSSSSSGASAATNYMTAIVNASRTDNTTPMKANVWMSMTEQGHTMDIYLALTATKSPTDAPPYGAFRLDYIGKSHVGSIMQFNGFIDSATTLQFYETGPNSSNVALNMAAGTTTSGSGTIAVGGSSPATFNFNYNSTNFRRSDSTNDRCFDRSHLTASKSVWRMGTYDNANGNRVDQTNPSFPIIAAYSGSSYYGYAGYYGIGFQGLDLNPLADGQISGLVATDQRPGNSTTYNLSKVGGKLTKWTQTPSNLAALDGIPFNFNGDMTGKTNNASGTGLVTGWGSWQMKWVGGTTNTFYVTGMQSCSVSGCNLTTFTTPDAVNTAAFDTTPISGWADSFGGNLNIPSTGGPHMDADGLSYYTQSTVIPGSVALTLNCLNNCPDTSSVGAANSYSTGTAPSPYGGSTATQWFSAPSGSTISYTFGASGLVEGSTPVIITNTNFYTGNFQWGVQTGKLFDTAFTTCGSGIVCEPSNPATYYTWTTGLGQWNQTMWLTKTTDNSVVAFDPPLNIAYTVPNDPTTYGIWANKGIQLQFNGFGNLYGIPGYCVSPVDNTQVDCGPNTRYVPEFSIPDGSTMSLGSTTLIVKALDAELRLKDIGLGTAAPCDILTLNTLTPPSSGAIDVSSTIGSAPTPASSTPKVIDGIVQ